MPVMSKEIKSIRENLKLPTKKNSGLNNYSGIFYKTFKDLAPILHKFFPLSPEKEHFLAHSMRSVQPGTKTKDLNKKRRLQEQLSLMNIDRKILNKTPANQF